MVLWQMLTLKTPYLDMLEPQQRGLHGILRAIQTTRLNIGAVRKNYSVEMSALTAALLSPKVEHRPTMMVVLHWPVLSSAPGLEPTSSAPLFADAAPPGRPAANVIVCDGVARAQDAALGEADRVPAPVETPCEAGGSPVSDSARAAEAIQRSFRRMGRQPLKPTPKRPPASSNPSEPAPPQRWYGAPAREAPLPGPYSGASPRGARRALHPPGGEKVQQRLEELRNRVAAQYWQAGPRANVPGAASPYEVAKAQLAEARQRSKDAEQARRAGVAEAVVAAPGGLAKPQAPEPMPPAVPQHEATPIRPLAKAAPEASPIGKGGLYPLSAARQAEATREEGKGFPAVADYPRPVRQPQQSALRAANHAARKAAHLAAYPDAPHGMAPSPSAAKQAGATPGLEGPKQAHDHPVSAARVAVRADLDRISQARHKDEEARRAAAAVFQDVPKR